MGILTPGRGSPFGSHTSPSLAWPASPLLVEGFLPWEGEREGLGEAPNSRMAVGFLVWYTSSPTPTTLPQLDIQARSSDPQLGPDPQPPSPSTQGLVGPAQDLLTAGRTFFCQKRQGCSCTRRGTSGSDSQHEWVMAPPLMIHWRGRE